MKYVLTFLFVTSLFASDQNIQKLKDEIYYQRAVQSFIWALPALSMYSMKEGSEKVFGKGFNVLPIWKERLSAKTKVLTPNSDVIYAMGYLNLKQDGPIVLEASPKMQGILDDFFQRPICSLSDINGKKWCGDIGIPGPDAGAGGKYVILPPDYQGKIPSGYFVYQSKTYNVFVFIRGFFKDPKNLSETVASIERTRLYPLGKEQSSLKMVFPDGSDKNPNMLFPTDASAFDVISRMINEEYVSEGDMEMRGMLAHIGIEKGKSFKPTAQEKALLDKAAKTAFEYAKFEANDPEGLGWSKKIYKDRQYIAPFPNGNSFFTAETFNHIGARSGYYVNAYSASPGMAASMVDLGAKYPAAFVDKNGDILNGSSFYKLHLPKDVPAKLFWSVTLYDQRSASGLDNGQPFPSINSMDKPLANKDGSYDFYFGPKDPGGDKTKNWIRTVPGKNFFASIRLYGPGKSYFDATWKPSDVEKIETSSMKQAQEEKK